jgi:hypothetical protein
LDLNDHPNIVVIYRFRIMELDMVDPAFEESPALWLVTFEANSAKPAEPGLVSVGNAVHDLLKVSVPSYYDRR